MTTLFTRQDYLDGRCSHEVYYAQFVTPAAKAWVLHFIGLGALRASTDPYYNDIALRKWDNFISSEAFHHAARAMRQAGDTASFTLGGAVCVAKAAARALLAQEGAQ